MADYHSGTATDNWNAIIGNVLSSGATAGSTTFLIADSDGNITDVTGTGFTYNAAKTAVTGGTITGLQRIVSGTPSGEQITGASSSAAKFWADGSQLADVFSGDDTFEIGQNELSAGGGEFDGYGGSNVLNEVGQTNDALIIQIDNIGPLLLDTAAASQTPVLLGNFNSYTVGSPTTLILEQTTPGITFTSVFIGDVDVHMSYYTIGSGDTGVLDLTGDILSGISDFTFSNALSSGNGTAEIKLASGQFGHSTVFRGDGEVHNLPMTDAIDVVMTTASFDASGILFDSNFTTTSSGTVTIDGRASSGNLTITGASVLTNIYGGSGNDSITVGSAAGYIYGSTGHDTITSGSSGSTVDYSNLTTPGIVAIDQGTSGTVNKGGSNGIDQLTGLINAIKGSTGGDVFYVDNHPIVTGNGGFDYLIELTAGTTITYGTQFTGISEIVSNTGNNTIDCTGDTSIAYLYGSTGNDTLTLGSGGGYLFGEGGTNTLTGGTNATNIFEGGAGTNDMLGGIGSTAANYYYVGSNDTVEGSGSFNAMIELVSGVSVVLGNGQYTDIQEFVADGGNNTATVSGIESSFVYLYGGAGNDTLSTSKGGGYLIGEGGTNTLNGGGGSGTNVFVADGASGVDTMNGGAGSNVYIIDSHSTVHGAGTFNTVEELQQNASLTLGSTSLTGVQQVVFAGGTNSADFHTATSSVFLYGGSGNDTLFGGTGNDFLYGGLGANTFEFGQNWGQDTIEDWTAGTGSLVDLTALASLGVHAVTDLTQTISGGHDTITSTHTGTNSITLLGVGSALTAGSFHFA